MADTRRGSCLCGEVRFEVSGPLREIVACHCQQCRKQTGHFVAATSAALGDVVIEGAESLTEFRASDTATRKFCSVCGSLLFWQTDGSENISILAGSFDDGDIPKLGRHIFCEDKASYYEINDGLPQFAKYD